MGEHPHNECPYVNCGSSDAFSFNDEGFGFCQSCKTPYPSNEPMHDWAKDKYPPREKPMDLKNWSPDLNGVKRKTFSDIRGIDTDVCKLYGIVRHTGKKGVWLQDGFKYPDNVKYRSPTAEGAKKTCKWSVRGGCTNDFFGPEFTPGASKRLYITEGEYDAASLYQILGKSWPVKGIPSSSINRKFLEHNYKELDAYESIVYAGELDDPGREAADLFYAAFPHKLLYVPLTKHKDANAYLNSDDAKELYWAAVKPQKYSPPNFFTGDDDWDYAIDNENPHESLDVGHKGLLGVTRGLVKGGITFWKAPRGAGKTEIFRYLERGVINAEGNHKIAVIHMEEQKSTMFRCWASYELGCNVRTKVDQKLSGVTQEEVKAAARKFKGGDRVIPFELLPTDEPMKICEYVRMAATVYGAEYIFIDHIQRLIYRTGAVDATGTLTQLGTTLAELGKDLNLSINCISHVNQQGTTQYASALENEAIIIVEVVRDIEAEDPIERDTTTLKVTKNRPFATCDEAGKVFYDRHTTILEETE